MAPRIPDRIAWAVEQLAAGPTDEVLEIGCGTGAAVGLICSHLTTGRLTAIDRSGTMIAAAQRNNQACLDSGRVIFLTTGLAEYRGRSITSTKPSP